MTNEPKQHEFNGLKLWWIEEHSETIIARTEAEARELYETSDEVESGPVTWDCQVNDAEAGTVSTLTEVFLAVASDDSNTFPCQLTSYYDV